MSGSRASGLPGGGRNLSIGELTLSPAAYADDGLPTLWVRVCPGGWVFSYTAMSDGVCVASVTSPELGLMEHATGCDIDIAAAMFSKYRERW